jgi:hypothetical protein
MKTGKLRVGLSSAFLAVLILSLFGGGGSGAATPVTRAVNFADFNEIQDRLLSGLADLELNPANQSALSQQPANYNPRGSNECTQVLRSDVKVNQDCLNLTDPDLQGRAQAQNETSIAQDPNNQNHVVASANDYRRGDGNCFAYYSLDGGRTWNDTNVPTSFTRGRVQNVVDFGASREYWGGGGDTSVAWDSKGNAYLSCQLFNRGRPTSNNSDTSSALVVFRSTQNYGASWTFPGRYVRASNDTTGSGFSPFLDKQLMTVDNNSLACPSSQIVVSPGSSCTPFQDRIYVSWTEFAADGTAYIYEAYSADYAEHFSSPHLVSINSPLCTNNYNIATPNGNCNENQFSQPFTGPDGALYIVYNNFNNTPKNAQDNRNQILLSKSVDGGNTFLPPVKVADYYDLPDCATYQQGKDFGRACVPEKNGTSNSVFRATNYASGGVNPTNPGQVVVSFGSYINVHSNEGNGCVPTGTNPSTGNNLYSGVKTPGACNNDILVSVSNDGGTTFTGTATDPRNLTTVNQEPGQASTDQFWQWLAFNKNGKLAVSYYDRQYGTDEVTGYSDISLSGSSNLLSFGVLRVTNASMPFPTEFGGLFFGDYSGLTAYNNALPFWMDTRNPEVFLCPGSGTTGTAPQVCNAYSSGTNPAILLNDQDVFVANVAIPGK